MMQENTSRYKWYALFLAMMTYGSIAGAARLCMPVLFPDIAVDLDLSLVKIGAVWGMDPLAGVFIGLPGGLLVDRFGIKKTLAVVCILAGIFGAVRGLAFDFTSMSVFMFLFGFMGAVVPTVTPKVVAVWFTGKRLALANGMLNVAWSAGAVLATLSSATLLAPWLGGWQNVLFLFGIPPFILGFLWWFTGREPEGKAEEITELAPANIPFKQSLLTVFRIKNVWLVGMVLLLYWGTNMGFSGYLPIYLRDIGWEPTTADTAMTLFSGFGALGIMPIIIWSNKLGSRKSVLTVVIIITALSLGLVPFINSTGIWVVIIFSGLIRAAPMAIANTMLFEMEEIGSKYAGTAIGLASTLGMIGSFTSPPIGNSLAGPFGNGAPIVFWAGLSAISLPLLLMLKERKISLKR